MINNWYKKKINMLSYNKIKLFSTIPGMPIFKAFKKNGFVDILTLGHNKSKNGHFYRHLEPSKSSARSKLSFHVFDKSKLFINYLYKYNLFCKKLSMESKNAQHLPTYYTSNQKLTVATDSLNEANELKAEFKKKGYDGNMNILYYSKRDNYLVDYNSKLLEFCDNSASKLKEKINSINNNFVNKIPFTTDDYNITSSVVSRAALNSLKNYLKPATSNYDLCKLKWSFIKDAIARGRNVREKLKNKNDAIMVVKEFTKLNDFNNKKIVIGRKNLFKITKHPRLMTQYEKCVDKKSYKDIFCSNYIFLKSGQKYHDNSIYDLSRKLWFKKSFAIIDTNSMAPYYYNFLHDDDDVIKYFGNDDSKSVRAFIIKLINKTNKKYLIEKVTD